MTDPAQSRDVLRPLGRVVRGLSSLFWGLPLALVLSVRTLTTDWMRPMGILPSLLAVGLLLYGLWQLGAFQKQERVWIAALDRARLLALVMAGLVPFLHWWNQAPGVPWFRQMTALLLVIALLFLVFLNRMLHRLAAMLPDETLRHETAFFTGVSQVVLLVLLVMLVGIYTLAQLGISPVVILPNPFAAPRLQQWIVLCMILLPVVAVSLPFAAPRLQQWIVLCMILLPVALTMTLIWKIKEVILAGVFGPTP